MPANDLTEGASVLHVAANDNPGYDFKAAPMLNEAHSRDQWELLVVTVAVIEWPPWPSRSHHGTHPIAVYRDDLNT